MPSAMIRFDASGTLGQSLRVLVGTELWPYLLVLSQEEVGRASELLVVLVL
jgi:hypothetical protein